MQDRWGRRAIRPAGAGWLNPRCQPIRITTSRVVTSAVPQGDKLFLTLNDGTERSVDHALLATGFRVDIAHYPFLSKPLLKSIETINGHPKLKNGFESSVPGLHFLGAPAAWSFGPLMRFVAGADFASRNLTRGILGRVKSITVQK